jgi:hypothetical protein
VQIEIIEGAGHGGAEFTSPERIKLMLDFLIKHWTGATQ